MTTFEQYVGVVKQLEVLEKIKDELRQTIEKELPEDGFKDDTVNAFWTIKKSWKYSPKVDELAVALKTTKKEEEEKGIAVADEIKQLTIKVK